MIDYKSLYCYLFNGITDVITKMENSTDKCDKEIINQLKLLQINAEELYLKQGDKEKTGG